MRSVFNNDYKSFSLILVLVLALNQTLPAMQVDQSFGSKVPICTPYGVKYVDPVFPSDSNGSSDLGHHCMLCVVCGEQVISYISNTAFDTIIYPRVEETVKVNDRILVDLVAIFSPLLPRDPPFFS